MKPEKQRFKNTKINLSTKIKARDSYNKETYLHAVKTQVEDVFVFVVVVFEVLCRCMYTSTIHARNMSVGEAAVSLYLCHAG